MKKILAIAAMVSLMSAPLSASASDFTPKKDIEWVVTSSPGGGSDIYSRFISDAMTKANLANGKTFLVTNKTDGGGEVGRLNVSRTAAGARADHTLMTFNSGDLMPMVKNTSNRLANFTPLAIMAEDKQLLFIGESTKYKTFDEVIKAVKGGAKVVVAGSKGDDVATYEKLIKELKFSEDQLAFIVNDSTSAAITSILGGHVDLVMSKPAAADQYVVAGKLTPVLALSSTRFTGNLRNAPRLSEVGSYKDVEFPVWRGVVGPKTMSPEAVTFWSNALKAVSESEAWQKDYIGKFKLVPTFLDHKAAKALMTKFEQDYLKSIGK